MPFASFGMLQKEPVPWRLASFCIDRLIQNLFQFVTMRFRMHTKDVSVLFYDVQMYGAEMKNI